MKNVVEALSGNEAVFPKGSFLHQVFHFLPEKMKNLGLTFEDFLFIRYGNNSTHVELRMNEEKIKHPKKVLIWEGGENKLHDIDDVAPKFHHVFAHYHWGGDNITPIPLGYHTYYHDTKPVPMGERLYDVSFVGCLNRNRVALASAITGIPKGLIRLGLFVNKNLTLKILNFKAKWRHPSCYFAFNPYFNDGVNAEQYQFILRHSKIALVPTGWTNAETFRFYEAMRAGCFVWSDTLPDRPFYKGATSQLPWGVPWDGFEFVDKAFIPILKNLAPQMDDKYMKKVIDYYQENLSPEATAELIAQTLVSKGAKQNDPVE